MIPKLVTSKQKRKKPPACDSCKLRRVLCHPQPNSAACPRCVEKKIKCMTTPVVRGKQRNDSLVSLEYALITPSPQQGFATQTSWNSVFFTSNACPDLNPEIVRHFFDCFAQLPQYLHPITHDTSIETAVNDASFQLNVLPPRSRALALCIIAMGSLISFDETVLGPGPRPESFLDRQFFISDTDVRSCGVRRATIFRALHAEALKVSVEARVILEVSEENTATCFILSLLEQYEFCGPTRPWGSAFYSHIRSIAATWKASEVERIGHHWAGFLMAEALLATKHRKPQLITKNDQLLICGPEPCSLQALLSSLEKSVRRQPLSVLFHSMKPYSFHVTCLARQLHETISGDHARLHPLSEGAVLDVLGSLSMLQSIVAFLIEKIDATLLDPMASTSMVLNGVGTTSVDATVRLCAFGITLGFTGILLPFYRELEHRINTADVTTREMVLDGARTFAKGIRYLPPFAHQTHLQWFFLAAWAEFCLDETDASAVVSPEDIEVLETIAAEVNIIGYSMDLSPHAGLIERLQRYMSASPAWSIEPTLDLLVPPEMFPPTDNSWMAQFSGEIGIMDDLDFNIFT